MSGSSPKPIVTCDQYHAILCVSDLDAAVQYYTEKLGFFLAFKWGEPPTMAGVNIGNIQIFLEKGTPAPQGCGVYFVIDDAEALYQFHRANGVDVKQEIGERDWDFRDYTIRDLYGYHLTFGQRL